LEALKKNGDFGIAKYNPETRAIEIKKVSELSETELEYYAKSISENSKHAGKELESATRQGYNEPELPETRSGREFEGTLRGIKTTLPGVQTRTITYRKIDPRAAESARAVFNSTDRPAFLTALASDPQRVTQLKKAGLTDADIAMMNAGGVPRGYNVHHKIPIDAGGGNESSNLILMKNEPYHYTVTNYQNELIRGMNVGEVKTFDYPIPEGFIYPP
jgi:hypothetical protein